MILNGSDILIECLIEQDVECIFGYPGGSVLNIYDAIYKYKDKITHYLTAHEQGAAHAADGYSRATGKVGVCLATSGPGATNLVTGIATAYMDSIPMVAITGNVALNLLGKDSFQEVDIAGITMTITKHNFIVKDISELADIVRRAFHIAKSNRPGPVLIDIPKNITADLYEYEPKKPLKVLPVIKSIKDTDVEKVISLIENSKKPIIYAGGGVIASEASNELLTFAEKIDSPVSLSIMGTGAFPTNHKLFTGMVGMHGSKTSNLGVTNSDLLIAIGARFSDRVTSDVSKFAKNASIIHIDIDPAEIDKNVITNASVVGDIKEVLKILNKKINKLSHENWINEINLIKSQNNKMQETSDILKPQYILKCISELSRGENIITTEVGQHQMWACQNIEYKKPRTFLTSGGLGTMGFGLGASIGASVGVKGEKVYLIAGDGCFRMNNIELATAVEYQLPIIVCIFNNHSLGMVRQWQKFFYDKRFSHTTLERTTDFVELAKAYKAEAFNVTKKNEVMEILKKAQLIKGPVVINFEISSDENVFPMVAPGQGIDNILTD